ncbi:hypothetical protein TNCV_4458631 [Trichonephila clavipes]|nr:hypothetical protein TNCV_4458631 [Trichonephila clavipes]
MRAKAYCAPPSTRDLLALRCMSRCPDQVVSLKRGPQCLSPQASLVFINQPTEVGIKADSTLHRPGIEFERLVGKRNSLPLDPSTGLNISITIL